MNREEWLELAANEHCWPLIESKGGDRPEKMRYSIGFPKGSRGGKLAIGQCWAPDVSHDAHFEIFCSPLISARETLVTLLHELVHASVGLACQHKGEFKTLALAIGFKAPMKTTPPTPELNILIDQWMTQLPPFPGATMDLSKESKPKPGSRLIKAQCPECKYTIRLTQKWVDIAVPECPNEHCEHYRGMMRVGDE